jgi:hypothetical protein
VLGSGFKVQDLHESLSDRLTSWPCLFVFRPGLLRVLVPMTRLLTLFCPLLACMFDAMPGGAGQRRVHGLYESGE